MTKQFHGITSLGLIGVGTVIAAVAMFKASWVLGVVYLGVCLMASLTIPRVYCAKCPCKAHCAHVFPGKAAMAFHREPGSYTATELAILVVALLALIGFPQLWLWRYPGWFLVYWALTGVALLQVRLVVCRA